jgi:small subunit ribosomal protein S20
LAKTSLSVLKRQRQNKRQQLRNRKRKKALKESIKEIRAAGSKAEALKLMPKVQKAIDKSARHNILHNNTARRLKSRIAKEAAEQD